MNEPRNASPQRAQAAAQASDRQAMERRYEARQYALGAGLSVLLTALVIRVCALGIG